MHRVSIVEAPTGATADIWRELDDHSKVLARDITVYGSRLSPPPFRSFLPPDFIYGPLQGVLHWPLAKSGNIVVRWSNILRLISKGSTSRRFRNLPSTTLASQSSLFVCSSWL